MLGHNLPSPSILKSVVFWKTERSHLHLSSTKLSLSSLQQPSHHTSFPTTHQPHPHLLTIKLTHSVASHPGSTALTLTFGLPQIISSTPSHHNTKKHSPLRTSQTLHQMQLRRLTHRIRHTTAPRDNPRNTTRDNEDAAPGVRVEGR